VGNKWEKKGRFGWSAAVLGGGERPVVVSRWWGRWMPEVGVGGFGFLGGENRRWVSGTVQRLEKMGENGKKCDLKQVMQGL
jgi:hypothetical protein